MASKPTTTADEPTTATEEHPLKTEHPANSWVRFIHPNGPQRIARLGLVVNTNDVVEVPADVAERLLAAPTLWQPAEAPSVDTNTETTEEA